jgi:heptosyltransferase II
MTEMKAINYPCRAPKVCVFQKAFLGDVLLASPLIQALCEKGCDVTVLTHAQGKEILSHVCHSLPLKYIVVEKPLAFWRRPLRTFRLLKQYWNQFDVSFELQRGFECGLLAWGGSKLWAIGFQEAEASFLFHNTFKRDPSLHEIEKNNGLLTSLWPDIPKNKPGWARATTYKGHGFKRFGINGSYGIIHPGTQWETKGWPFPKYIDLLRQVSGERRQWIVTGDKKDLKKWKMLKGELPPHSINLMGKLSISEYLQLCSNADVIVANDSFATHVGSAYDVPTITIFGSTVPEFGFGPRAGRSQIIEKEGITCRPCGVHGHRRCPETHFKCMRDITVREVYEVVQTIEEAHS